MASGASSYPAFRGVRDAGDATTFSGIVLRGLRDWPSAAAEGRTLRVAHSQQLRPTLAFAAKRHLGEMNRGTELLAKRPTAGVRLIQPVICGESLREDKSGFNGRREGEGNDDLACGIRGAVVDILAIGG